MALEKPRKFPCIGIELSASYFKKSVAMEFVMKYGSTMNIGVTIM